MSAPEERPGKGPSKERRSVFISYRRLDDKPPPEKPKAKGFVGYFWGQLSWELTNLGLPEGVLWIDRGKLAHADEFSQVIADELARSDIFLAILSRNYVRSDWCRAELEAFANRLGELGGDARKRRIFRIDKQSIPEEELPPQLRGLQAAQFYEVDPETGMEQEFYYRGRVVQSKSYNKAIHELAVSIFNRLQELGLRPGQMAAAAPAPSLLPRPASNGRSIFVAWPAADLADAYAGLVRELEGRGYQVLTGQDLQLQPDGREALETVRRKLAAAEVSIHLLGEWRGMRPDKLKERIVPLQLAEAAAVAATRPGFERLIWAPRVVPGAAADAPARDPLAVLAGFDRQLPQDQVEGDTAARFNEFVLQRLQARVQPAPSATPAPAPSAAAAPRKATVYVSCLAADQRLALTAARELQALGLRTLPAPLAGEGAARRALESLVERADHAVFCWGEAEEGALLEALASPSLHAWQEARPAARLILLCFGPAGELKQTACALGAFGPAELVLDATQPGWIERLAPSLALTA